MRYAYNSNGDIIGWTTGDVLLINGVEADTIESEEDLDPLEHQVKEGKLVKRAKPLQEKEDPRSQAAMSALARVQINRSAK